MISPYALHDRSASAPDTTSPPALALVPDDGSPLTSWLGPPSATGPPSGAQLERSIRRPKAKTADGTKRSSRFLTTHGRSQTEPTTSPLDESIDALLPRLHRTVGDAERIEVIEELVRAYHARSQLPGGEGRGEVDKDAAIKLANELLDLTPLSDPKRAARVHSLATWTHMRGKVRRAPIVAQLTLQPGDADAAIDLADEAIGLIADDSTERPALLTTLASWLQMRRGSDGTDLDRAVDFITTAIELTPHDDPARGERLHTSALVHLERRQRTDPALALASLNELLGSTPANHPHRPARLAALARALFLADVAGHQERALELAQEAVGAKPAIKEHVVALACALVWNGRAVEALGHIPVVGAGIDTAAFDCAASSLDLDLVGSTLRAANAVLALDASERPPSTDEAMRTALLLVQSVARRTDLAKLAEQSLVWPEIGSARETFLDLLAHAHGASQRRIIIAGAGPTGQAAASYIAARDVHRLVNEPPMRLLSALACRPLRIEVWEGRLMEDEARPGHRRWRGDKDNNTRREQVITLQDAVIGASARLRRL